MSAVLGAGRLPDTASGIIEPGSAMDATYSETDGFGSGGGIDIVEYEFVTPENTIRIRVRVN